MPEGPGSLPGSVSAQVPAGENGVHVPWSLSEVEPPGRRTSPAPPEPVPEGILERLQARGWRKGIELRSSFASAPVDVTAAPQAMTRTHLGGADRSAQSR